MPIDPLDSAHIIKDFPDHALLDIARNDSAQEEYRLFAVELLHARKSPKLQHRDIQHLVMELEIELEGIVFEHPAIENPQPMRASVTTRTLYGEPDEQFTGFDFELAPVEIIPNTGSELIEEGIVVDLSPTEPAPVPPEPKPKRTYTRKPKEPDDAVSPQ